MRSDTWKWPFTWEGRVERLPYFLTGAILVAVKYAIDRWVAARFGESWQIWNYFLPIRDLSLVELGNRQPQLYAILWAISIPFFWMGLALTLRRLHDAGKSAGWIFLFFAPAANLALFLWLSLAPSAPLGAVRHIEARERASAPGARRAALGMAFSVLLGVVLVSLGARCLQGYGWGLFLGVPFLTGFVSSWFLNFDSPRSKLKTIGGGTLTVVLLGMVLFGFAYEGLLCLLMALPLALPFAIAGGLVARCILRSRTPGSAGPTLAAGMALLPLLMFAEHAAKIEPPVFSVTTGVTIDAPPAVVWKNVIAFPPLAPPEEWLFRAGIAYPTSGEIVGRGPGAVRYCHFSTGDFVEPLPCGMKTGCSHSTFLPSRSPCAS